MATFDERFGAIENFPAVSESELRQVTPRAGEVSWRNMADPNTGMTSRSNAPLLGLSQPTYAPQPKSAMYQWGPLAFEVWPLNVHEFDHETDTDWAQKEIAGSAIFREWVGENDENIYFRGKVFPYRIGGMSELELMEANRRQGIAQALIRSGGNEGTHLGWYVIEKLVRAHKFLSSEGVGQVIEFEAVFTRVPIPNDPTGHFQQMWSAGYVGG
jgi:phage tail protein